MQPFAMNLKMLLKLPSLSQLQVLTQIYQRFGLESLGRLGTCIFLSVSSKSLDCSQL
jgi:hypothetical protein